MESPSLHSLRAESLLRVPGWADAEVDMRLIEKGGSDRRYYRLTARDVKEGAPESAILMIYTDVRPDNASFFAATDVLRASGARAMSVYWHDEERRLAWMEDLGPDDLWERRRQGDALELYRDALRQVAHLHRMPPDAAPAELLKRLQRGFDAALYQWEQDYFFNEFALRFSALEEAELEKVRRAGGFARVRDALAALPRSMVHRDFQSQNVIIRNGGEAWMIDYQGLRPGRPEYDVASLVYDPYVSLTREERQELIAYYRDFRLSEDGVETPPEVLAMCACQRLMQALGAYGRLGMVLGKTEFLRHVPAAVENLRGVLAESGLLPELAAVLELKEHPAFTEGGETGASEQPLSAA